MKRSLAGIIFSVIASQSAYAEEAIEPDLLKSLQQDMQLFSDIATETKQNVDYMPYVISTLKSEDLQSLGVLNLREAISLVPGVDLNVGMAGVKNPIFRGSNPYAFGQSRLIIDGMVVNDQIFGGYNQYLEMPVDIIHRIEVVRGPGSMLTHVNGYAGSIHVITKANRDDGETQKDTVFVMAGSDEYASGGFIKSFELADGRFSTDLYYQQHNLHLPVGDDRIGLPPNSADTDQSLKNYQLGVNYQNGGFTAKSRFSQNDSGVSYGQAFSITDDESDFLDVGNNSVEVKYINQFTDKIELEIALDYFDETRELQNKVVPDGGTVPPPVNTVLNGRYFLVDYNEQSFTERLQLNVSFSERHKLKVGLNFQQSEIKENNASTSDDVLLTFNTFNLFSNEKRDTNTFYIEDMFDIGDKTTLQLGGKLSQYNDIEDQSAIRIAAVHRYDDVNVFKAMFSQAYREPSWREQYLTAPAFFRPNVVLDVERVNAYELAYIRRMGHREFIKFNTFLLQNSEQIDAQNAARTFNNTVDNELYGFEFEYETSLFDRDILNFNYSLVEGSNVSGELVNTAETLVKLYYLYRASDKWSYSGVVKFTDEKGRVIADTREDVDAFSVLDLNASYQADPDAIRFSLSVKNALDKTYFLPSPDNTYDGDFEQSGRTWLLRLSKEF